MPAMPGIEIPLFPEPGLLPSQITPTGTTITFDGNSLLVASATKAFWISDFIKRTTPLFNDVTPTDLGSFQIVAVAISPFYTKSAIPGWILASDGTDSAVWYSPNVAIGSAVWTKGATLTGVYTVLRATNIPSTIVVYSPNASSSTTTTVYDFTVSDGGFTVRTASIIAGNAGSYTALTGWVDGDYTASSAGNNYRGVIIDKTISSATVLGVDVKYDVTGVSTDQIGSNDAFAIYVNGVRQASVTFDQQSDGTDKIGSWAGSVPSGTTIEIQNDSSYFSTSTYQGSAKIKSVTITTRSDPATRSEVSRTERIANPSFSRSGT
jgi:hypothetical protein